MAAVGKSGLQTMVGWLLRLNRERDVREDVTGKRCKIGNDLILSKSILDN